VDESFEVRGVNHLALVSSDMKRTVEFYRDILGFPLIKTLELPDGMGQHFFFDIGKGNCLAFFWFPNAPQAVPGVTAPAALPGRGDLTSAVGSMNHIALDVSPEKIEAYKVRLREKGIQCTGVVNHDDSDAGWSRDMHDGVFMRSIYFFDPDGLSLEFAAWTRVMTSDDVSHEPHSSAEVHSAV
jgi:catechol 2,3-dioxygenase-like lactoylglutathione lyase family enzyme